MPRKRALGDPLEDELRDYIKSFSHVIRFERENDALGQ